MQKAAPKGTAVYDLGSIQAESAKWHSNNIAKKHAPGPALFQPDLLHVLTTG